MLEQERQQQHTSGRWGEWDGISVVPTADNYFRMKWHLKAASLAFGNIFWTHHHHKLHSGHFSKAIHLLKKENIPKVKWIHIKNVGIQKKMIVGVQECSTEDSCIPFSQIPIAISAHAARSKSYLSSWMVFQGEAGNKGLAALGHRHSGTATCCCTAPPRAPPALKDTLDTCSGSLSYKDDISQRTLKSQPLINTWFIIRITSSVVLARWSRQGEASHGCGFDLLDTVIAFWDERTKICVKILMANV